MHGKTESAFAAFHNETSVGISSPCQGQNQNVSPQRDGIARQHHQGTCPRSALPSSCTWAAEVTDLLCCTTSSNISQPAKMCLYPFVSQLTCTQRCFGKDMDRFQHRSRVRACENSAIPGGDIPKTARPLCVSVALHASGKHAHLHPLATKGFMVVTATGGRNDSDLPAGSAPNRRTEPSLAWLICL